MSHQSDQEYVGSRSRTPPSPDTTSQWHHSVISGRPMVSAPVADVRPFLSRPPYAPYAPYSLYSPHSLYTSSPPYTPIGGAGRYDQTFQSEYDVSMETENDRIISGLRRDVEYERNRRLQCETRSQEQRQRERRLQERLEGFNRVFQQKEDKLRHELEEKEKEVAERTRQWKKAAGDLNRLRASAQGFYQITDEYLTGLISSLRFSIRNFSLQYFEGKSSSSTFFAMPPNYRGHVRAILPGKEAEIYAGVHSKRNHQIIQALIWRVLVADVFGRFPWVGGKTGESFKHLRTKLDPAQSGDSKRSEPEAERKFQTWSATTIGLLLDAQSPEEQSQIQQGMEDETARIVGCLLNTLEAMVKFEEQEAEDGLTSIISEAYVVGKEISRQTARITWMFDLEKEPETPQLGAETMELESGQHVKKTQEVSWVVAPGVMKRGKSTGEGFDHEEMLLKRIISSDK
ncbi:hypothetical protein BHE90_010412 [Fusarium euwallaceae]|uniref:Uncharacterized protein n=1 Tax=Fusarium euwallaceae TaxID=1147111 RepID=A0A430LHD5_9HYPO|nr:hypothetical protein BHE90_010412 [Fusarium euwallaceae]